MEELQLEFTQETIDFASEWYKKTAKEYITKYPEVILRMSQEQISNMKTKINRLVKDTEKIVKVELMNPELWWHKKPDLHVSIEQYTQIGDKYSEILDRAVRRALGHLGVILEEYRFQVDASGNTGLYHEFWFDRLQSTGKIVPIYPHLLKWTNEMEETIKKYSTQFIQAFTLYNEIHKFKEEKKKQEAITRWDST
jgi:hypothetical protein